jgi:glycosyltransferase involved in cell wall biosynthesis
MLSTGISDSTQDTSLPKISKNVSAMQKTCSVSVLITNYNYGHYLTACLLSVANGMMVHDDMEILIVDDASTDNSLSVINDFLQQYPKLSFQVIRNEINLGLIRSRNLAIHKARGKYVFILDADNHIGPDCLGLHLEAMRQNPGAIACYGRIQDFLDSTGEIAGVRSDVAFSYELLLRGPYIDAMAMFDRKALIEIGLYNQDMPSYGNEDYELWLRIGKAGKRVVFMDCAPLSFYRIHDSNMGKRIIDNTFNQILFFLKSLYPVSIAFSPTELLDYKTETGDDYAQLFYQHNNEAMTESNSIQVPVNSPTLIFSLPVVKPFTKLRFDPLNDYVKLELKSVTFLYKNEVLALDYSLQTNACHKEDQVYLFDTQDPQMEIVIHSDPPVTIDEVHFTLAYLQTGKDALICCYSLVEESLQDCKTRLDIQHEHYQTLEQSYNSTLSTYHQLMGEYQQQQRQLLGLQAHLAQRRSVVKEKIIQMTNKWFR